MTAFKDCEHFIPLRKQELIDLLVADNRLTPAEAEDFRRFCTQVSATCHLHFHRKLEELKTAYAPFDPDSDTRPLVRLRAEEKQHRLNLLFSDLAWLMERANFQHLSCHDLEPFLEKASEWGVRMDVDFSAFERFAMFARGDTLQPRMRRRLRGGFRKESITLPVFQRLVLILKLRPHKRHLGQVDTESVYLKIFKDIPKLDVAMLLPGARVLMNYLDRGKITLPLGMGLGLASYNILQNIAAFSADFAGTVLNPTFLWGAALGTLGYSYRSFYGYQQTKQRYRLTLAQSLYYQNLDNNSGVLYRLLNEAEEQECREIILGYFFLWRGAGEQGWTSAELETAIEQSLERQAGVKVHFEVRDALARLQQLRVLEKTGERYRAQPLPMAQALLDSTWNHFFDSPTSHLDQPLRRVNGQHTPLAPEPQEGATRQ